MMSDGLHDASGEELHILLAEKLYSPDEVEGPVAVVVDGSMIRAMWRHVDGAEARARLATWFPGREARVTDLRPFWLAPGYIDLHTHGYRGHDVTTGAPAHLAAMASELPATGVTAFYPTIATTGRHEMLEQVQRLAALASREETTPVAQMLGVRLEGPFINRAKKGAQYEPAIRSPDPTEMEQLATAGHGWVRIVDFAPEEDRDGLLLATLTRLGILPSIGHTMATYDEAIRAIDVGARHATHLFNAMPPLAHRAPGTVGAFLTDRRTSVEMIADGIHLYPAILRLVLNVRGPRDIALVTDAMAAAGLPDGEYQFIGRTVHVKQGAVRLEDGGLAGSTLTMDRAVRNMVALAGAGWPDAIRMATETPARIAGIVERKGTVRPGSDADLAALDGDGTVQKVWARGCLAYNREISGR